MTQAAKELVEAVEDRAAIFLGAVEANGRARAEASTFVSKRDQYLRLQRQIDDRKVQLVIGAGGPKALGGNDAERKHGQEVLFLNDPTLQGLINDMERARNQMEIAEQEAKYFRYSVRLISGFLAGDSEADEPTI